MSRFWAANLNAELFLFWLFVVIHFTISFFFFSYFCGYYIQLSEAQIDWTEWSTRWENKILYFSVSGVKTENFCSDWSICAMKLFSYCCSSHFFFDGILSFTFLFRWKFVIKRFCLRFPMKNKKRELLHI